MLATSRGSCKRGEPMALTDEDRLILDFEQGWWLLPGAKEDAIRSQLAMSPSSYYRALAELIERPEALAYDPLLVRRIRRTREQRRRTRFEGQPTGQRRP